MIEPYWNFTDYFRTDPPVGVEFAAKGTKVQCLHCHLWYVLDKPWKVRDLISALRWHRLIDCNERTRRN